MKLPQTIMGLSGIARVAKCLALALVFGLAMPAQAQVIDRTISITYTPERGAPKTWKWRNMGTYFRAIAQMSTDPVALPFYNTVDLKSGATMTIQERAQNGDVARTIVLGHGLYRYTYYRFDHAYFKDTENLGAGMNALYKTLPTLAEFNGLPTGVLAYPTSPLAPRRDARALPTLALRAQLMRTLLLCPGLSPVQVMNLPTNFDAPDALHVTLSPMGNADPSDIAFLDGLIRTRTTVPVSRLYMDRQGIWDAAMAERPLPAP